MKLTSLDLNLLVTFVAIYETRSVSRAGERLGARQPAVSATLARLRTTFGDELFVRAGGLMQPTSEAMRIAPGIRKALADLSDALADAEPFSPEIVERTFTIASIDYASLVIVPTLMAAIQSRAPSVNIRIIGYDKNDIPDLIDCGAIDVALGIFQNAPPRAVRKLLCPERFVGLCRRDHPLVTRGAVSLEDYTAASHALVTVRRDDQGEVDAAMGRQGLSRRIALTLPHMLVLPSILETTDLLSAVPERIAAKFGGDSLQTFELPIHLPSWRIEMLYNAGARSDRGSSWLRSMIVSAVGGT